MKTSKNREINEALQIEIWRRKERRSKKYVFLTVFKVDKVVLRRIASGRAYHSFGP